MKKHTGIELRATVILALAALAAFVALGAVTGHLDVLAALGAPGSFGILMLGVVAQKQAAVVDHPMQHMRPHWRFVGTIAGTIWGGAAKSIRLLKTGYAGCLVIRFSGQYDVGVGGTTLSNVNGGPYFLAKNVRVQPPGGQRPWDGDGWNTKMLNFTDRDFAPFISGADAMTVNPAFMNGVARNAISDEAFPNTTNTANQLFQFWLVVPFHRSAYDLRGILPAERYDIDLWVTPAAIADIFTTAAQITNATLVVDVFQQVFDAPPKDPSIGDVDTRWILAIEEFTNQFGAPAVGDNKVEVTSKGIYLDILKTLILNSALDSADISQVGLRIGDNQWDTEKIDRKLWDFWVRGVIGRDMPKGVVLWDFDRFLDADGAAGLMNEHFMLGMGEWLVLDDALPKVQAITNISGGVAGTSNLKAITRRLLFTA